MPLKAVLATVVRPLRVSRIVHSAPRPGLEDLPFELLEQIFRLACTDGGRTGCSLSLVSKHVRAASISTRFRSVSIPVSEDTLQLDRFFQSFEHACVQAILQRAPRPHVRHMCLRLASAPQKTSLHAAVLSKQTRNRRGTKHYRMNASELTDSTASAQRLSRAIITLFQRVGTVSLESLALVGDEVSCSQGGLNLLHSPEGFPNLRELVMAVCTAEVDFAWWAANAPRLERVRVVVEQHVQEEIKFLPGLISVLSHTRYGKHSSTTPLWPDLQSIEFAYHAILTMHGSQYLADRDAYIVRLRRLFASFDCVRPLVSFMPRYTLQDDPSNPSSADWEEAQKRNAYVYEDWQSGMTGHTRTLGNFSWPHTTA
ncbi:hypothetical protein GY45DRAFT_1318281 [Cubamyces sp. BRFM 1775]|nr:hypothetical protein GY45DRAFT_1318281 [Cubamyces sp. BRFM 1775]